MTGTAEQLPITSDERLQRELAPGEYATIRERFLHHYEREQAGDVDGILTTMTPDCTYHLPQLGQRWQGHAGARVFYGALLGAFPDNTWDIDDLAIGPQGVLVVTTLHGRLAQPIFGFDASKVGQLFRWRIVIMYPWDPAQAKFTGETVYSFQPEPEG
ncbi:MAG: nuclear transport factor 2 family protein [Chloroflexi bacterium]|nr:nuclear transport factor 2 family protein [Chloroflexota bacterium]